MAKSLLKRFDLDEPVYYADINWGELLKLSKKSQVRFSELSRFPSVKRDLALLLDSEVRFQDIVKVAFETEKRILKNVTLFDVYEGKNLEAGKKSYAVTFTLEDENATLNDKMIEKTMQRLIQNLDSRLGAKIR